MLVGVDERVKGVLRPGTTWSGKDMSFAMGFLKMRGLSLRTCCRVPVNTRAATHTEAEPSKTANFCGSRISCVCIVDQLLSSFGLMVGEAKGKEGGQSG